MTTLVVTRPIVTITLVVLAPTMVTATHTSYGQQSLTEAITTTTTSMVAVGTVPTTIPPRMRLGFVVSGDESSFPSRFLYRMFI